MHETLLGADVSDDDEELISNEIGIAVAYTAVTVPALLDIAESEDTTPDSLLCASRWVSEVVPDFGLTVPADDEEVRSRNAESIAAARRWWRQHGAD